LVFKRMLGALGVGGPSVDTVLTNPNCRPGGTLTGEVRLRGGDRPVDIEHVALGLVTRVEVETGGGDLATGAEFHRVPVAGAFALAANAEHAIPFQFPVPWETPVNDVYGQRLRGMTMGLRTELAVARAVDKGDLDPVAVHPLPVQERILEAFAALGMRFKSADVEHGRIYGVAQQLPIYQEIEFWPAPQYAGRINEVELTFVADPQAVTVVLEFDKRGGMFTGGHDAISRFTVPHADADRPDWTQVVDGWLRQATERHSRFAKQHAHPGHRRGVGMGGMAAGVAGGILGGMVLGEAIDEIGDMFE
jgi:sporulation-control protein